MQWNVLSNGATTPILTRPPGPSCGPWPRRDTKEIEDRFYRDLAFGTGGLRGILGAGSNRMNLYTVRKATQGLANFILKQGTAAKGVAISFDSRHMSPEFAEETAPVPECQRHPHLPV